MAIKRAKSRAAKPAPKTQKASAAAVVVADKEEAKLTKRVVPARGSNRKNLPEDDDDDVVEVNDTNETRDHEDVEDEDMVEEDEENEQEDEGENEQENDDDADDNDDDEDEEEADDDQDDEDDDNGTRKSRRVNDDGEPTNDDDDDDESVEVADDESDDDDDDMREDGEERRRRPLVNNDISVPGDEPCTFDLRNLLGVSAHPVDSVSLYVASKSKSSSPSTSDESSRSAPVTIDRTYHVNEEYLLSKAVAGCNQIISALWQLPVERSDAGPMVQLPSFDDSKIPRALPPPAQKAETKWEKFAKAKGIGQNKEKRSAKVFDEATGEWQYRHGYKKAGSDSKEWPIMEVKGGTDPFQDPWEAQRDAKRARVDKNVEARMRNVERAGGLAKGTSTRMLKSMAASRKAGKEGGALGVQLPVGVPLDLRPSGRKGNGELSEQHTNGATDKSRQRGKVSTMAALRATQVSTASLGKFDKMREGEPERKKVLVAGSKRKIMSNTDKKVIASEADRSLKVLKSLSSGSATKEKDRKKGRLATGETAYDYDYDDGLGASTFRKKKGRAGAGKMKKMTKKRAK